MERTCEGCTKCCEGWLTATIKGHEMYPGRPCHFVQEGKGCAIYSTRPKDPCRGFKCDWLQNPTVPEWMAPKDSGVIILKKQVGTIQYVELVTTGEPVTADVLTWFFLWGLETVGNIRWNGHPGRFHFYGSQQFVELMQTT